MSLVFQVVALPIALHLAMLSPLSTPEVPLADLREACRQLLVPLSCQWPAAATSAEQVGENSEEFPEAGCTALRASCRRLRREPQPCRNLLAVKTSSREDAQICRLARALSAVGFVNRPRRAAQETMSRLCDPDALRALADASIYRKELDELSNSEAALLLPATSLPGC
ncbi:unnamed protein product [Polarella glacialis]|uniref:Uncharacterized protein n=1 Tax=Polarella glacialis TaxID=89957 RepID=A0A813LN38_POLGL|nr:unnamed protein product [Polarella glacialis]